MERYDLSGAVWELGEGKSGSVIPGRLPGSNYLDLMAAGKISDPFWGQNEEAARKIAEKDYEYFRSFNLPAGFLNRKNIDLVVSGLDTLAAITLNGKEIARTDNCFRTYRFPVKEALQEENNHLTIYFENPFPSMAKKQRENPMSSMNGVKGVAHIRKVQCHFGWDWGPNLPPVGIFGGIALEAWSIRIEDLIVRQDHREKAVRLSVEAVLAGGAGTGLEAVCTLADPDGRKLNAQGAYKNTAFCFTFDVENPQLWWCNGLGEQPRYTLSVMVGDKTGAELDQVEKSIGLRTIKLDSTPDKWGAQFRFVVNGVPVFVRGADWIPSDAFVTRTSKDDLRFYIESARRANMNMLRVWGGGHYESDAFYELCDQYGIMVWQDFCFACSSYPFGDSTFAENVHHEVMDNVKRLRHRASLALWCGNNENEIMSLLWKKKKALFKSNNDFYYETLRDWVGALDGTTSYWPGSPSSNSLGIGANDLRYGDAHLWQVWHGLLPIEAFRKLPARFCSEFGLESFPSMRAVRTYTDKAEPDIKEPVMMAHQKSGGGNQKILFYLLAKYREPKKFAGMVYLSQLVQSGAMRFAVDQWRRNMDRSGGALYWQFNDCWPVASWAGIDYLKQYKAVHYHARHFNKPICLSNDYFKDRAEIYLANDLPRPFRGNLDWQFQDFTGRVIASGQESVETAASSARHILTLNYKEILKGPAAHKPLNKKSLVLYLTLIGEGNIIDQKNYLLAPDKYISFPKPKILIHTEIDGAGIDGGATAKIKFSADVFARYVYAEIDGIDAPLSDNFFDIPGGGDYEVSVPVSPGVTGADIESRIRVRTLADVEAKRSLAAGNLRRFLMRFNRTNLVTWFLFKFIT